MLAFENEKELFSLLTLAGANINDDKTLLLCKESLNAFQTANIKLRRKPDY